MLPYSSPVSAQFTRTFSQPQDALDDVVVATVNPQDATNADNCFALYKAHVMTALANVYTRDFGSAANFLSGNVIGFGKAVGLLTIYGGNKVVSYDNGPWTATELTRSVHHTLSWTETLRFEFAQNADASVIVGYGSDTNAKAVVSTNGGATWTEVSMPTALVNPADNIGVYWDRFDDSWYIFRESGGQYQVLRSTNDGASWTQKSLGNLPYSGTLDSLSVTSISGSLFANAGLNTLSSTYVSTDLGATWTAAAAGAGRYVNSIAEIDGTAFALGHTTTGSVPYVATWTGSSWSTVSAVFPGFGTYSVVSLTRLAVRAGPYLVTAGIAAFGTNSYGTLLATLDGVTWRQFGFSGLNDYYTSRKQNNSPGGLHVQLGNSADIVTVAATELW